MAENGNIDTEIQVDTAPQKNTQEYSVIHMEPALRTIDITDNEDIITFRRIMKELNPEKDYTDDELKELAINKPGNFVYGVSATEQPRPGQPDRRGKLIGSIMIREDDTPRQRWLRENGLIQPSDLLMDISYAVDPQLEHGMMRDSVMEACVYLSRYFGRSDANLEAKDREQFFQDQKKLPLDPTMSGEQIALDLQRKYLAWQARKMNEDNSPKAVVTAYIKPNNGPSIHLAEKAGFVKKGIMRGTAMNPEMRLLTEGDMPSEDEAYMYVLDWKQLHENVHAKVDPKVVPSSKEDSSASAILHLQEELRKAA